MGHCLCKSSPCVCLVKEGQPPDDRTYAKTSNLQREGVWTTQELSELVLVDSEENPDVEENTASVVRPSSPDSALGTCKQRHTYVMMTHQLLPGLFKQASALVHKEVPCPLTVGLFGHNQTDPQAFSKLVKILTKLKYLKL